MLELTITTGPEFYDEIKEEFIESKTQTLRLEHSLVSISKWESKWHKPFLTTDMTAEETIDYIKCMTLTQNVDPDIYNYISVENVNLVKSYIENPMTATTIREDKTGRKGRNIVTNEVIYGWMVTLNIPVEFQKWHLNRLITLIRVVEDQNKPTQKMSKGESLQRQAAINAQRRARMKKKG